MLRLVSKNRLTGYFGGSATSGNARLMRSSPTLATTNPSNDSKHDDSSADLSPSASRALSKLIERDRKLPQIYKNPEYEAIIHQCRQDVQLQIAAGGKPRMPFRLWKLIFSKANDYTLEEYSNLSPKERIVHGEHWRAMQERRFTYKDPSSGHEVMTTAALCLQGKCCGNGCRHCPYDHENMPEDLRKKKLWNGAFYV